MAFNDKCICTKTIIFVRMSYKIAKQIDN